MNTNSQNSAVSKPQFDVPILFMVFNRPDVTKVVFQKIRELRPKKLFLSADGPRLNRPNDAKLCEETRKIIENVDWPCEVKKLFHEKNLGCQIAPSMAVTWFFNTIPEGIVLEDDCVPDPSFFPFCKELLEKYRNNDKILQISASNFQQKNPKFNISESYYFSIVPHLWGWASWSRAWKLYDLEMKRWPEKEAQEIVSDFIDDPATFEYWTNLFNSYYYKNRDSWDRPWAFVSMLNKGLSITPKVNFVTNIGYGPEATHTKNTKSESSNLPSSPLDFPLIHPKEIEVNRNADLFTFKNEFGVNSSLQQKILGPFRRNFPVTYRRIKQLLNRI